MRLRGPLPGHAPAASRRLISRDPPQWVQTRIHRDRRTGNNGMKKRLNFVVRSTTDCAAVTPQNSHGYTDEG